MLSSACQWGRGHHSWNTPLGDLLVFPKIRRHYTRPGLVCIPWFWTRHCCNSEPGSSRKASLQPPGKPLDVVQWNFTGFHCAWWSGSCGHEVTSKGSFYPPHNLSFTAPSIQFPTPLPASDMLISCLLHSPGMLLVWCLPVSWTLNTFHMACSAPWLVSWLRCHLLHEI